MQHSIYQVCPTIDIQNHWGAVEYHAELKKKGHWLMCGQESTLYTEVQFFF